MPSHTRMPSRTCCRIPQRLPEWGLADGGRFASITTGLMRRQSCCNFMQASAAVSHPINSAFWEPELGDAGRHRAGLYKPHGVGVMPIDQFVADPSVAP